jgi:hypothetical protein
MALASRVRIKHWRLRSLGRASPESLARVARGKQIERHPHLKDSAAVVGIRSLDAAALRVHDRLRERQAETRARHIAGARGCPSIKAIEHLDQLGRGDARTRVGNPHERLGPRDPDFHVDTTAGPGELHGVVEQIRDHDLKRCATASCANHRTRLDEQLHAARASLRSQPFDTFAYGIVEDDCFDRVALLAGVEAGERKQLVQQQRQSGDLLGTGSQCLDVLVGFARPSQRHLELRPQA